MRMRGAKSMSCCRNAGKPTDGEDDGVWEDDEAVVHGVRADAELRVQGEYLGADHGERDESRRQLQQGDVGRPRRRRWQWIACRWSS
jgi:hypothetical protein